MSKDNNIQDFDSFFKEVFNSFEPTPPQGIFEAIQSQVGVAGSSVTTATVVAKTTAWGIGKIVTIAVAIATVATTTYFVATNTNTTNTVSNKNNPSSTQTQNSNTATNETTENTQTELVTPNTPATNNVYVTPNGGEDKNKLSIAKPKTPLANGTDETSPLANQKDDAGNVTPNQANTPTENVTLPKITAMVPLYVSETHVCANEVVTVTIADDLSKHSYRVDFGDGTTTVAKKGKPATHAYKSNGLYKITATEIGGAKECIPQNVTIYKPKAAFKATLLEKSTYSFTNTSENGLYYTWVFGDAATSDEVSPIHSYKCFEAKKYKVKLIAIDAAGCVDSFSTQVVNSFIHENKKPLVPNVFTPTGDGKNDKFEIVIENEEKYHLMIFDSKGNKVFESEDKNDLWDGKNMYTGAECPSTTYRIVFYYKIVEFEEASITGLITLKR